MTDSHSVIFYIMLTALLANLVASAISRHSFYDRLKLDYLHEMKTFGEEKEEEPQKEEIESDDEENKKESWYFSSNPITSSLPIIHFKFRKSLYLVQRYLLLNME